ncbi:MAG: sulfite exporter TauE/SafE family protein [Spongiibacteraceae bacterium]|nr:sulfite exporter TauE/SafE family protein [Spongiibacteraceae bacterium]
MLITDPIFYLITIPAVLLYWMGKGGLGASAAAISVPMMSLVLEPIQAAAILLPIICVMDAFTIKTFWKKYDVASLKVIIPASLIGVVIGSFMLGSLSQHSIKIAMGVISISFCINYWFVGDRLTKIINSRWSGYFWAATAGFTSTHIHAGGPPITIYLAAKHLDKFKLIGTMAIFFAVLNYVKLIPYSLLGQFNKENLLMSLVLVPLAPIGVRLGYMFLNKIEQEILYKIIYWGLFLSGLKLLVDGVKVILV